MTSLGHVTSSGACPDDSPWALFYRLSIGTIPSSGFVSEIISPKVATKIITWWRHQWRHSQDQLYVRTIPHRRIAGEEAFYIKIMMSPLWRHRVTWRHREHDQSITHGHFPTIHTGGTYCQDTGMCRRQVGRSEGEGEHDPLPPNRENIFRAIST